MHASLDTLLQNDVGLQESSLSQVIVLGFTGVGPDEGDGDGDGEGGDGGVGDGGDGGVGEGGEGLEPHASSASCGKCVHWLFTAPGPLSTQETHASPDLPGQAFATASSQGPAVAMAMSVSTTAQCI